tara:strand:- start:183 stop:332 length:150 start_codon:yes stop_codon:yes gene_type:complete
MEEVAELTILAMVMFVAAFFCYRVLLIPNASIKSIEKIHEVEDMLSGNE